MATSSLPTRSLGRNGPQVAAIGLGCMGLSAFYMDRQDDPNKVLARSLGCNFWDTADIYADNEDLLSQILKERRNEVFLCTKFANTPNGPNGKPEYVRSACEKSLKRLGVQTIDLYYMHRMDPTTPVEDTVRTMAELVKEGKVRYLGLSECSAETLRRAHKVHPISAVQIEYSPWTTDHERNGVIATCRELGIAIVAYSPLGRGFLAGKFKKFEDLDPNDWRRNSPRFQGENFQKNLQLVKEIERVAEKKGCNAAQLCLAWVMAQGDDIIPIPGTTSVQNLVANVASLKVKLDKEDLAEIRKIIESIPVAGERYPEANMRNLGK
eukprot:TRINITY_DN3553_c0_g1_i1.p1 TRINITY_DN3553_c0_g1~~TRINITY_DN3553_c0_g1_i1.p1  ORF type:complete len:324 (+),score=48.87 TRINITY_DN3553_c0_g1_i1:89-1060(+)